MDMQQQVHARSVLVARVVYLEPAELAKLRARHGVYFVTGNHEYYSGAAEWIEALGKLGRLGVGRSSVGRGRYPHR